MTDLNDLDPGICRTVLQLRDWGFTTTDSGDGMSKPEEERTIDAPHVAMVVRPAENAIRECDRLAGLLTERGIPLASRGLGSLPSLEVLYEPTDGVAVMLLRGLSDADWIGDDHG